MKLRCINYSDEDRLKEIHSKYFSSEFEFPNFFDNFLSSFVVADENNEIIAGGGIRPIVEAVIITNKDIEIEKRRLALIEILRMSMFATAVREYKELHAFIQDDKWLRHLKKAGFRETKGRSLVLSV